MCIALVLIVESPMIAMEKVLFGRKKDENKASSTIPNELASNNVKENGFSKNEKFESINL